MFFNRFRRCFSAPCGEGERRGDGFTVSKTTPNLTKLLKPIPSNVLKVLVVGDFQKVVFKNQIINKRFFEESLKE